MEVRLLGPVALVGVRGEMELPRSQCRCVLAVLALEVGKPVAADSLIDRVWGDRPPRRADHALYTHVSALRRGLQQAADDGGTLLRRTSGGYVLDIDAEDVDLNRARRLAGEARSAANGDPDRAREALGLLRRACEQWQGVPLGGVSGNWAARLRDGLDQERLAMQIDRHRLEIQLGDHARVVGPLSQLLAEHPLVEPLAELQMLALYGCGRQAEALALYAETRRQLVEALGDEPGDRLQWLHARILRRDPSLIPEAIGTQKRPPGTLEQPPGESGRDLAVPNPEPPETRPVVPAQLPADVAGFTGRTAELAQLDSLLPAPPATRDGSAETRGGSTRTRDDAMTVAVLVLDGAPGVGKSALVTHWAHRVRGRFPDGQLYVDLRGYSPGSPMPSLDALASSLHAFGVRGEQVPSDLAEVATVYRSMTADKRLLVVLDNAADSEQVRPLLPSGGGSLALVTSRDYLGGLVARDGARRMDLSVLPAADAHALMASLLGAERVAAEPEATAELVALCDCLPLALRVAAANLIGTPTHRVAHYVARLRDHERLEALRVPGEAQGAVASALELSYRRRSRLEQRIFRLAALIPGPEVTVEAAAALAGVSVAAAGRLMRNLAEAHLVIDRGEDRFALHDLLRHFAAARAYEQEPEGERQAALTRWYDFYLSTADAAARLLYPEKSRLPVADVVDTSAPRVSLQDHGAALAWLDRELPNLVAAVRHPDESVRRRAWQIADTLRGYFLLQRPVASWLATSQAALAASEADGALLGQAAAHLSLGDLDFKQSRYVQAIAHYDEVMALTGRVTIAHVGEERDWLVELQAAATNNLGNAHVLCGRLHEAEEQYRQSLALVSQRWPSMAGALQLGNIGDICQATGELERALAHHEQALAFVRAAGSRSAEAVLLQRLGVSHHLLGDLELAAELHTTAIPLHQLAGDRASELETQCCLALVYRDAGGPADTLATEALAQARDLGDRMLLAVAFITLGSIHYGQQHHPSALRHYQEALQVADGAGIFEWRAQALTGAARSHLQLGDPEAAGCYVDRALAALHASDHRLLEAEALTAQAELRVQQSQGHAAIEAAERALSIFEPSGVWRGQAASHQVLSSAYGQIGERGEASRHRDHAARLSTMRPRRD